MKNVTLAATIILLSLSNINAQKKTSIDYTVTTSFNREFKDAAHVQWSKITDDIFLSRFENHLEHCIAYFTKKGQLLLTGRKVSIEILPLIVKRRAEEIQIMNETKTNKLTIREVYELAGDYGTEYFMNLTSEKLDLSVIVSGDGTSKVLERSNLPSENERVAILTADRD
jgi:hypothetical protein